MRDPGYAISKSVRPTGTDAFLVSGFFDLRGGRELPVGLFPDPSDLVSDGTSS
jgi:hypothetical protein